MTKNRNHTAQATPTNIVLSILDTGIRSNEESFAQRSAVVVPQQAAKPLFSQSEVADEKTPKVHKRICPPSTRVRTREMGNAPPRSEF